MAWQFKPPLWSWLVVTLLGAGMASAGIWQLQRGDAKTALGERLLAAQAGPAANLPVDARAVPGSIVRVAVQGRWRTEQQILLDNQPRNGAPGYHVWTPLVRERGVLLIVDRGWVPQDPDRSRRPDLPLPEGEVTIEGLWKALPVPGLRTGNPDCATGRWPRVLQYPDAAELECALGEPVADGVLLLEPAAADGFLREWSAAPAVPPARHYGYAAQWFALALLLAGIFVKVNLKRVA